MPETHSSNSRSRPGFTHRDATAVTGGSSPEAEFRSSTNSSIAGAPKACCDKGLLNLKAVEGTTRNEAESFSEEGSKRQRELAARASVIRFGPPHGSRSARRS